MPTDSKLQNFQLSGWRDSVILMPQEILLDSKEFSIIVEQLREKGWAVSDQLLSSLLARQLLDSLLRLKSEDKMRPARIGRASTRQRRHQIRGDSIYWIQPPQAVPPESDFLGWAEEFMIHLGRALFIPMDFFECHYSSYPAGARYRLHKDQFNGSDERRISFVLYLNENWSEELGGQLRIYQENSKSVIDTEVLPVFGRVAVFLSQSIYHEVLPAQRERYSLTGWMKLNDIQKNPLTLISS